MVVVGDECRHIKACHIINYRVLALCVTREAEIYVVGLQIAADIRLIAGSGTGCASALSDRRAVEDYGLFVDVGQGSGYGRALRKTYGKLVYTAVEGQIYGKILGSATETKLIGNVVASRCGREAEASLKGMVTLRVLDIEIAAVFAQKSHVIHKMVTALEVLATQQKNVAEQVEKIDSKVTRLEESPMRRIYTLIGYIVAALCSACAGAFFSGGFDLTLL